MSLDNITFIQGQGGLGRPLPGEDYISGIIYYTANGNLPSGFTTANRIKQIFSVQQAEAAGIKSDYSDATAATSTSTVTAVGANGDKVTVSMQEPTRTITFGTYTKVAGDADAQAVATAIAAIINLGTGTYLDAKGQTVTVQHGYTAVADGTPAGELIITAPKSLGIYLNTKSPAFTENPTGSTFAITIGAFTGGVASKQAVWHYHISEYFRIQPKGNLFVGFFAVPGTYDFAEVGTVQTFAVGKIRQFGVYKDATALASADLTALSNACAAQVSLHKETMGVLGADISATVDLTTLPDLSALAASNAMCVIGQDGAAQGAFLYATVGKSITTLGATLGALALAKVSESIAWVQKFDLSDGTELDTAALANGTLLSTFTDENLLTELQKRSYTFIRKFVGTAGSYHNSSRTAVAQTSDYAYAENVRTIQKGQRSIYISLTPALSAPIELNVDGTLNDYTIEYFRSLAEKNLFQMQRDKEISNFAINIDSTQNVLATGNFVVSADLQPIGVARSITVNIGFKVQIS